MAGTLQILGCHLGEPLKPGDQANPRGYFENTAITDLNKHLLSEAGVPWYDHPLQAVRAVPWRPATSSALRERLQTIFGEASPIVIKDPRLCVLLDLYVETLREMGYEVHCVRMGRKPIAVAESLIVLLGRTVDHWLPILERHTTLLDEAIHRQKVTRVDCSFDDLVQRPEVALHQLVAGVPCIALTPATQQAALRFIDSSLKHH